MIQEIKYNGITTVPSDYECPDGDLSGMINAVIEDGVVRPLCPPDKIFTPPNGFRIAYIHKIGEQTNYIMYADVYKWVIWRPADGSIGADITQISGVKSINSIGNTLVVIADDGMHYILWKADEQKYKYLGTQIPELDISFGLQGHVKFKYTHFDYDEIPTENKYKEFSDNNRKKITDQVLADVNLFIAEETINKGRFCFPFFIRYALRLYDGTLVNHSAPILMMPSTKECPTISMERIDEKSARGVMMLVASDVDYLVLPNQSAIKNDWGDIVKDVVVYASKPIYTYDQNGECKKFINTLGGTLKNNFFIGKPCIASVSSTPGEDVLFMPEDDDKIKKEAEKYYEWKWYDLYALFNITNGQTNRQFPNLPMLELPMRDKETIREDITGTSTFYLLKSLPIENMDLSKTNRSIIEINKEYLQSLTSREVMTDDYLTHDKKMPSYTYAFNSKLSLANVKRELYRGYNPYSMFSYCQGAHSVNYVPNSNYLSINEYDKQCQYNMRIDVFVKDDSGNKIVRHTADYTNEQIPIAKFRRHDAAGNKIPTDWGSHLFYPNGNAYKIRITEKYDYDNPDPDAPDIDDIPVPEFPDIDNPDIDDNPDPGAKNAIMPDIEYVINARFEYNLEPHSFLNGSFHYIGNDTHNFEVVKELSNLIPLYKAPIVSDPNKVYTSEINNPFFFPVTSINTIGTGEIYGISSAVKALSQGQFGQFPMYVFSSDGVWALETSATGAFVAKQPVTRDVCICPESITQLDGAVLFATDKGIMMIEGSNTTCISQDLDRDAQDLTAFPHLLDLLNKHNYPIPSVDCNFKDYVKNCRMVYDYTNQRIIVANPNESYAYVYSMKSNTWGMIESTIADSINSYPEAYAVDNKGALIDFSNPLIQQVKATLLTRPIKFGAPNDLKTIRTIVQRGLIERNDIKSILYGSRDLINWHPLASTTTSFLKGISGTPYKYFRIASMVDFTNDKSLYGATIDVEPKLNNRIR